MALLEVSGTLTVGDLVASTDLTVGDEVLLPDLPLMELVVSRVSAVGDEVLSLDLTDLAVLRPFDLEILNALADITDEGDPVTDEGEPVTDEGDPVIDEGEPVGASVRAGGSSGSNTLGDDVDVIGEPLGDDVIGEPLGDDVTGAAEGETEGAKGEAVGDTELQGIMGVGTTLVFDALAQRYSVLQQFSIPFKMVPL